MSDGTISGPDGRPDFIQRDEWPGDVGGMSLRRQYEESAFGIMARMQSVLSDRDIKRALDCGAVVIDPLRENAVQPSSVDLSLGCDFKLFTRRYGWHALNSEVAIDTRRPVDDLMETRRLDHDQPITLAPLEFALGVTTERIELPDTLVGRLDGVSSLGRLGLLIHATAGLVDPGWKGRLTLELMNLAPFPITLYVGMRIGQLSLFKMSTAVEHPYHGKYQSDDTVTESRFYREA